MNSNNPTFYKLSFAAFTCLPPMKGRSSARTYRPLKEGYRRKIDQNLFPKERELFKRDREQLFLLPLFLVLPFEPLDLKNPLPSNDLFFSSNNPLFMKSKNSKNSPFPFLFNLSTPSYLFHLKIFLPKENLRFQLST